MSLSSQESDKSKDDHVLDVYQTVMENEGTTDTQKAIVREMCNVVWRVMDKKKWICEDLKKYQSSQINQLFLQRLKITENVSINTKPR